jgi:hypothetical protein
MLNRDCYCWERESWVFPHTLFLFSNDKIFFYFHFSHTNFFPHLCCCVLSREFFSFPNNSENINEFFSSLVLVWIMLGKWKILSFPLETRRKVKCESPSEHFHLLLNSVPSSSHFLYHVEEVSYVCARQRRKHSGNYLKSCQNFQVSSLLPYYIGELWSLDWLRDSYVRKRCLNFCFKTCKKLPLSWERIFTAINFAHR